MADIKIFNPDGMSKPGLTATWRSPRHKGWSSLPARRPSMRTARPWAAAISKRNANRSFANIHTALRSVNADWNNVVQFRTYMLRPEDADAYRAWRGKAFPKMFPTGAYPPHTLLIISRLADEAYLLEVEAMAAL